MAREHGLPAEILTRAEQNLLLDGGDSSKVLNRLNELAVERERELDSLKREQRKLDEKRKRLDERYQTESAKVLERLQAASQEIVRAWREGKIERKKALADLAKARESLQKPAASKLPPEDALSLDSLVIGEQVRYLPWDKLGVVQAVDIKRRQIKLDIGGVSLWVEIGDCARSAASRESVKQAKVLVRAEAGEQLSLDLRGMRAEEALASLARFCDQALLRGASRADVIHGKGSGALRREVHAFLKDFPAVARFSLASEEEGGDGKTIIEFP